MDQPHILVADDDACSLKLLADLLGIHGYRVSTAESADEALAVMDSQTLDAIVTDRHMPGGGLTVVARAAPGIPVILTTVDFDSVPAETRQRVILAPKPLSIQALIATIGELLEGRKSA